MNNRYILDNNIVLDFLLNRFDDFPDVIYLIPYIKCFYISSTQLDNIRYVFEKKRKLFKKFSKK